MQKFILSYFATLVPLLSLDAVWIIIISKNFYAKYLGFLISKSINFTPIVFFYPFYALALLVLAVFPAVSGGSWFEALWRGALLGLAAYGAYDLTNQATIANWPTIITIVDIGWGVLVSALASLVAYLIIMYFK